MASLLCRALSESEPKVKLKLSANQPEENVKE